LACNRVNKLVANLVATGAAVGIWAESGNSHGIASRDAMQKKEVTSQREEK
jgi:hypothetical protein